MSSTPQLSRADSRKSPGYRSPGSCRPWPVGWCSSEAEPLIARAVSLSPTAHPDLIAYLGLVEDKLGDLPKAEWAFARRYGASPIATNSALLWRSFSSRKANSRTR
jgi:hypothetical protein